MTAHHLTATTTDTMAATASDTATLNSTTAAPPRVVRRSLMGNRILWGSAVDINPTGPTFSDVTSEFYTFYTPGNPITLGITFVVERPVTFTGCRIYKAPNATGTAIPVKLWSGTTTGTELGSATIGSWTVDGGGWRQVTFTPVDLVPDVTYTVGFFSADGIYAYTPWVFQAQDTVVWPLHNQQLADASGVRTRGTATMYNEAAITFPTIHWATNWYVDPQVEWTDAMPGYTGGTGYHDQWLSPWTRHAFPLAVFHSDPPFLADYYAMGVNTLIGGYVGTPDYVDAMNAMGNTMDWWTSFDAASPQTVVQVMTENPGVAGQVVGYQLDDEPDMSSPYRSPDLLGGWRNSLRQLDSTRPFYLTFGKWAVRNQGFAWSPSGGSPLLVNELWRQWGGLADVVACDDYAWYFDNNSSGLYGVWVYAAQVGRMREITDDRIPVWAVVETTSEVSDAVPTPANVVKAIWAALIAGARGIVLFDHRFANDFVTQDFAHMLHNPPMKAAVTTLAAQLQTLGPALLAPDLGLVTAYISSNTTAGPLGGTYGVPIHYTSRTDGTYQYVFAQAIRAGATTATLTIPAWAGLTVTVLDESRSEVVSGGGVLTDSFAADYQVHIYRRTL